MPNLLWFSEISSEDKETCGKKGVLFGELYNIGLPVPQVKTKKHAEKREFYLENYII